MEKLQNEVAPPGWSGTVAAMLRKHPEIKNPYALAWSMKNKGGKAHYKEMPKKDTKSKAKLVKKEKYKDEDEKPKKKHHRKFSEWIAEEHPLFFAQGTVTT